MKKADTALFSTALTEVAKRLVTDQLLPLDVTAVCRALSIRVTYGLLPGKARAGVVKGLHGSEIRLAERAGTDAWQRFLIAHELGHIILERECAPPPMGQGEYWRHEELCDSFAALLLVPDALLQE